MENILLLEDLPEIRVWLRKLVLQVFPMSKIAESSRVHDALELAGALRFDLALIDLGLPDGDGESLLAALRSGRAVPTIVVSARHGEGHKIRLLDAGADDYLVKPFSLGELLARMRVALRHRGTAMPAALTRYEREDVTVDLSARRVTRAGRNVHLTPTEYKLLARLVRHAGQVVTHRQLLADVWGAEYTEHTHYLRLYMGQLRAKLEANAADPRLLLTEPGVGYRLAEPA